MQFNKQLLLPGLMLLSLTMLSGCDEEEKSSPVSTHATSTTSKYVPILKHNIIIAPAIVDSSKDVTRVSISEPGIVDKILVSVGHVVEANSPLLELKNANIRLRNELDKGQKQLQENELMVAKNLLDIEKNYLKYHVNIHDNRAVSKSRMSELNSQVSKAELMVQNHIRRVEIAETEIKLSNERLADSILKSPEKGKVLQVNIKPGEYLRPSYESPAILLGNSDKAFVRVAISTKDVWKFKPELSAYVKTWGDNPQIIPLTFVRVDAYAVSKEFSLSQPMAQSDERSLEVVYYFERNKFPQIFPGESFDAYIGEANK